MKISISSVFCFVVLTSLSKYLLLTDFSVFSAALFEPMLIIGYAMAVLLICWSGRISKHSFVFLSLAIAVPLISAIRASDVFNQPIYYGLLSERGWLQFGLFVVVSILIARHNYFWGALKSAITWSAILVLAMFLFFYAASFFTSLEAYNIGYMSTDRGLRFQFPKLFLTVGTFLYFLKYLTKRRVIDLAIFVAFILCALFIVKGRTYILTLLIGLGFIMYKTDFFKRKKHLIRAVPIIGSVGAGLIFLVTSLALSSETDVQFIDTSVLSRYQQIQIALPYFADTNNLLFGTGRLSHHFYEGYSGLFGHFYPSDIGILGGVFLYGVVGTVVFLGIDLWLSLQVCSVKHSKLSEIDVHFTALQGLAFANVIFIWQRGSFLGPSLSLLLVLIAWRYSTLRKTSANNYKVAHAAL